MIRREWLHVEYIETGPGQPPARKSIEQRLLVDYGPARCVDEVSSGLEERQIMCVDQPPSPFAQLQVDRHHVGRTKEFLFAHRPYPSGPSLLAVEILAPRDQFHPEGLTDFRHLRP